MAAEVPARPPQPQSPGERRRFGRIESLLVERGVVSFDAMAAAKDRQRGAKRPLVEVLLEQQAVDEDRLVAVLAEALGMPVSPPEALDPDPAVQDLVPPDVVQRLGLLPLRSAHGVLTVATGDPLQVPALDEIAQRTGLKVEPMFFKPSAVRAAIGRARGGEEALHDILKNAVSDPAALRIADEKGAGQERVGVDVSSIAAGDGPTIRFVNLVLSDAIRQGASDVHIEAEKDALRIRFRVDGDLRDVLSVPSSLHSAVVSRIKIMAHLDIIETRRPQDGRIKVTLDAKEYDLRVSSMPAYFGEKVVVRVLDASAATFDLGKCGLEPDVLAKWRELIRRPHGLLLLTGPTGSGKTSTLYASLLEIRTPTLNLVTVEDPVEYQFPGIVQVPVRSSIGMTFAAALRSILRQDPDVVLVGEIRDAETAQVALQAAMTGHLVLSTLHTNDAIGAIPRLLDLGVEPQIVASSLLGVMSQRLVRTVCQGCSMPHRYPDEDLRALGWDGTAPAAGTRKGRGCRKCRNSGLRGRAALVELVVVTPGLAHRIAARAPDADLAAQSVADGTVPIVAAGLRKVLTGVSVPEQVREVAACDVEGAVAAPTEPARGGVAGHERASHLPPAAARDPAPPPAGAGSPGGPGPEGRRCVACGEAWTASWRFCPSCGAAAPPVSGTVAIVCDDDATSRRVVATALRTEFGRVIEAPDGRTALDLVAASLPALLVVDQDMPEMTGIDVIRALRSAVETAVLPILMLTGSTDESMETASLDAGADDYLQKPAPPQRLRARARALVAARRRWSGGDSQTGR